MKKFLVIVLMAALFAGCGAQTEKNEIAITEEEKSDTSYGLVAAEKMDVTNSISINLSYGATETVDYSFSTKNAVIEFIYVERGDIVKKGDVLATLESDDILAKIDGYEHRIKQKELSKKQLIENKEFEIETAEYMLTYTAKTEEDYEELAKKKEAIEKQYASSIQSLDDELTILRLRLEEAQKTYDESRIVATVDGVVSFCKTGIEGTRVVPDEVIIRLYDEKKCMFTSSDKSKAEYVTKGQEYTLVTGTGSGRVDYTVVPVKMDEWGYNLYFEAVDNDNPITMNTHGTITIVIDEAIDVIAIPTSTLHRSKDKYFVYYLDESGVRRMKWVTPGLVGNEYTEIVKGLDEGEIIITK